MNLFEGKTEAERKKLKVALVLTPIALLAMLYMLFGGSSKSKNRTAANTAKTSKTARTPAANIAAIKPEDVRANEPPRPIEYQPAAFLSTGTGRNIFTFSAYNPNASTTVARVATAPVMTPEPVVPTPPPAPPPPVILAGLAPSTVYANSGAFQLQASGDKFSPETRIYFNGQELNTEYVTPQLVKATVPASLITSSGERSVVVRTPDNSLFSNTVNFSVAQPPAPQYVFVGLVGASRRRPETAVLKPRNSTGKEDLINVQRGDLVGGRFRVTNISERAVEFVDKELNMKHSLPFTDPRIAGNAAASSTTANPYGQMQPQPMQPTRPQGDEGDEDEGSDEEIDEEPPTR